MKAEGRIAAGEVPLGRVTIPRMGMVTQIRRRWIARRAVAALTCHECDGLLDPNTVVVCGSARYCGDVCAESAHAGSAW